MSEPSNDARRAKFEQDQLRDKQINAFLLHRKNLQDALAGNEADLKHIGYHFPESPAPEKKYTMTEAVRYIQDNGNEIIRKSKHHDLCASNEALKNEVTKLNGIIYKLKTNKKPSKKK